MDSTFMAMQFASYLVFDVFPVLSEGMVSAGHCVIQEAGVDKSHQDHMAAWT